MFIFLQSLSHNLHFPKALRDLMFANWKLLGIIKMKVLFDRGIFRTFGKISLNLISVHTVAFQNEMLCNKTTNRQVRLQNCRHYLCPLKRKKNQTSQPLVDLVTDKCIEDKIELNYYFEKTELNGRYKLTLTYKVKVADGIEKIPKLR